MGISMIYHDGGHRSPQESLEFFREHKDLLVGIKSVVMTNWKYDLAVYPLRVIGEMAEVWLSGCDGGYGYNGTITVLKDLGYSDEACGVVSKSVEFQLGPPNRWKPKPVPKKSIPDLAMEVLEFIEEFYAENRFMPTGAEINDGCPNITSRAGAHERLHSLKEMGYIDIRHRKPRGIVLL